MRRILKEYVLENWSLKLTALLLATMLWLIVRSEPGLERVIRGVPLEVQLPRHMEITKEDPTSVEVTVRGAALSDLFLSQPVPTTCLVDLSGAKEGEHVITLTPENVKISKGSGIEVMQVNPARVTLIMEQTVSKEVPITVPVRGEPFRGFEVYGRNSKPGTIIITGPRTHVEPVRDVSTEVIQINDQKQPVRAFVGLNIRDNFIRTSATNPIQVDVQIGPRRKLYTVGAVPVTIDNDTYAAAPKQISVQVVAPAQMPEDLTASDFRAFVNTRNMDLSKLPVKVKPVVTVLNNSGNTITVKEVWPTEVSLQKKKK
jgi:YbbR domain-containing protein